MNPYLSQPAQLPRRFTAAALIAAILTLSPPCEAAAGLTMKLDGLDTWSELAGAVSEMPAPAASGTSSAPVVRISKVSDKTSPMLLQACGDGALIRRLTLASRDADGVVTRITLDNVLVRSFRTNARPATAPLEEWTFTFDRIEWSWFGHDGRDVLVGGLGADYEVGAQRVTAKTYPPFRAGLERVEGRAALKLTCPVERGRTYRISASTSLNGQWEKLEDFTALEDGQSERILTGTSTRLFLRVEALD